MRNPIHLSTFYYIQSSKPIMSSLPEGVPLEIKKALQAIDFKFDAEKQSNPFYFVSYSEVKMRGWNTAANDLKDNLTKVLDLVQKDPYLIDKDNTIRILSLNIERFHKWALKELHMELAEQNVLRTMATMQVWQMDI